MRVNFLGLVQMVLIAVMLGLTCLMLWYGHQQNEFDELKMRRATIQMHPYPAH